MHQFVPSTRCVPLDPYKTLPKDINSPLLKALVY